MRAGSSSCDITDLTERAALLEVAVMATEDNKSVFCCSVMGGISACSILSMSTSLLSVSLRSRKSDILMSAGRSTGLLIGGSLTTEGSVLCVVVATAVSIFGSKLTTLFGAVVVGIDNTTDEVAPCCLANESALFTAAMSVTLATVSAEDL